MRDFPVFTTEQGVSSLFLKEIPYRETAYIRVRDVQAEGFGAHLAECIGFCRACGAERIYAAGHEALAAYPVHTAVLRMQGRAPEDAAGTACLVPVTRETVGAWRQILNRRMRGVDASATQEARDEAEILGSNGACFIHEEGRLLGIGWLRDRELLAVAAVERGAGERVLRTLLSLVPGETVHLEVADTNGPALELYKRMGFAVTAEVVRWHRVHP